MKVGLTLPQFRHEAGPVIDTARRAEQAGLDGVFVFDHLWPLGRPDRPALHGPTLAAALLAETDRLHVGTLVARVGLLPDAVLVHALVTLHRMGGDRFIAGLGVGDSMSRPENEGLGVPFLPKDQRLARLVEVCRRLRSRGVTTWVGGKSPAVRAVAAEEADALNLWDVPPEALVTLAGDQARAGRLTWAGPVDLAALDTDQVRAVLRSVAASGATWAVVAPVGATWPAAVETVAAAREAFID